MFKILYFVPRGRFGFASRLAVARLGLTTTSRFRLLAKHRSGVQISHQNKILYFVPRGRFELPHSCEHTALNRTCLPFHHLGFYNVA